MRQGRLSRASVPSLLLATAACGLVQVQASGQADSRALTTPDPGDEVTFTGVIVDPDNNGIGGASIILLPDTFTLQRQVLGRWDHDDRYSLWSHLDVRRQLARTTTGADGRFLLVGHSLLRRDPVDQGMVDIDRYRPRLVVTDDARVTRVIRLPRFAGGHVDVGTITLESGGSVVGRVTAQDGAPLVGSIVFPWLEHASSDRAARPQAPAESADDYDLDRAVMAAVEVDADGRFEVTGLLPGTVTLRIECANHVDMQLEAAVRAQERHDIGDVAMSSGRVREGRVVDELGSPVAGASVFSDWPHDWGGWQGAMPAAAEIAASKIEVARFLGFKPDATTAADGSFRVGGGVDEFPGLVVSAPDFEPLWVPDVAPDADAPLVLQHSAVLNMAIIDEASRKPIPEAACVARRITNAAGGRIELSVTPGGAPGQVRVHGLGTQGTELIASAPGYARRGNLEAAVRVGSVIERTIQLGPEWRVQGRIVEPDGSACANAEVSLSTRLSGSVDDRRWIRTDSEGGYSFGELGRGRVRIAAYPRGLVKAAVWQDFDLVTAATDLPDLVAP